ncbi:metal ABC transporter solute-binding protein, Zn/Mn family [Priestia taiwanensis]|uniref:Manganese-binding lipoprotein MntA n=1 Tax=Priestia taiwanensis TaxID=1347902 RepID=A0A917AR91_9BACI|nr:zinc ABC transporter substrate-binding protein [Priestia taiwanensis]MBM7363006.1 manganese/zinc/iron transport system substrate-binding protein [Priestia taiwanensis]GGE66876.1 manganese-binding lipoprotein MntA [Priestia taiwanensis]
MKRVRVFLTVVLLSVAALLVGCTSESATESKDKLTITTTTGMVADIVKNIGGEHVDVEYLMGPGVDPHLYKASQGDIKKIENADVVFYSGLYLEGKMVDIFEKLEKKKPVFSVTEKISTSKLQKDPEAPDAYDPHVWFDVSLWMEAAEETKNRLIEVDEKNKETYEANATKYLKELEEVHAYAKEQLATIPKEQRVLVTAHDAFGYLEAAYGVEVQGLQGMSTASEYGLKDVQNIIDLLTSRKIKAVFVESSIPTKSIESVVEGAKAKGHTVEIGGELFSDAMGEDGTPAGTYIGMVRHNVDTIVKALK